MNTIIDRHAAHVLSIGQAANAPPFELGTPAQARIDYIAGLPILQGVRDAVASVEDRVLKTADGELTVRIYRGTGAPPQDAPSLLYLHGGGWVIGNLISHDEICRWFANEAGCVVVCPDYRLAPEHKFPAGLTDCLDVLHFMANSATDLGIDPQRIAVSGDSAGGNLASVVALFSRSDHVPAVAAQLLFYPNTDATQTADSYRHYSEGFGLTAATMRWFREHYIRTPDDITDWRVSPLRADSLADAPPAFIALAGLDILKDEGTAYGVRLQQEGVRVISRLWPGQIHGFVSMGRHIPAAREAVVEAVAAWRSLEVLKV
ncbi:alpha/beta hydrolase [Rhizobium oryziradicis]|uniref:Lipase n=1 Tax=Rhizobium oryziradicis TaxID=1867956 RepID=A0A1Q8ZY61_9HYPH|nr:alpha/beta hydrolase [Rhizobium oryziradicis]OLP46983.1 lipase [Rhizobium oryziradicis]